MPDRYWKFQSQNVQIFGYVYRNTNGQNHGPRMEDPVVFLKQNLYGHPLAGPLWERQFEKVLLKYGWEKVPHWECLFVNRDKQTILVCVCGRYKTGWEETKHWPNVERTWERSRFGSTNIIPWQCPFGLYSTGLRTEQRYCGQSQGHVWI